MGSLAANIVTANAVASFGAVGPLRTFAEDGADGVVAMNTATLSLTMSGGKVHAAPAGVQTEPLKQEVGVAQPEQLMFAGQDF